MVVLIALGFCGIIMLIIIYIKKMKKIFLSAVVVCSAFVFSGCGSQKEVQTPVQPVEKSAPTENGGVVNSIKEAIGLGSKMKCTSDRKSVV